MSMIRPLAWLTAIALIVGLASRATAQGVPTSPGSSTFWEFQPFLDPGYFQPDFQFFAPAEVDDFGGEEKPNSGVYVTFDRTYVGVSRPKDPFSFGSQNQMDFTWGNRMEIGYMKGDPSGWQAVLWHVNGPNECIANAQFLQEFADAGQTSFAQVPTPGAVDSINQLKMSSFELNKIWRRPAFHNNVNFEPFVGYRYMNVRDFYQRQSMTEFPPTAFTPALTGEMFERDTHNANFENNMHGGQLGARFFRQRGHWLLSADIRMFALANFQTLTIRNSQSILPNPETLNVLGTADDAINFFGTGGDINITRYTNQHVTQFCWGGEARAEASYELTRDINLRAGFVFLDMGQGIGRGDRLRFNNQAVQMAGATFGFTVNR
jgi:hypothetical protein